MITNLLIAGVGGQGVILAGDTIAEIAVQKGYDVKKADSFGMAQRGGSVTSHVRLGERVFSPVIKKGDADFVVAFERLEGARNAGYLKPGGVAIINDQVVLPLSSSGEAEYPSVETVRSIFAERTSEIYFLPGRKIAEELGNSQVLNVLLLGFLSVFLALGEEEYILDLKQRIPARFLELNLKAFARGREEAQAMRIGKPAA